VRLLYTKDAGRELISVIQDYSASSSGTVTGDAQAFLQ